MSAIGLIPAFLGGLASFLSPCVLPLIPVYLSMISGYSASEIRAGQGRLRIATRSLAFILGFSSVFSLLSIIIAGTATLLGGMTRVLEIAFGAVVVLLGTNMIFDFIKALGRTLKLGPKLQSAKNPLGYGGAFVLGAAFGAGWTPCVGPVLSSILLVAAQGRNIANAVGLLFAYSLGLGLPFLLAGLFLDRLSPLFGWFKRHSVIVRVISGLCIVILGVVMILGKLSSLAQLAIF